MKFVSRLVLGVLLIALIPAAASAATLIDENLNAAGDAASFTEVDGFDPNAGVDSQVIWGFDYSAVDGGVGGLGPAPNTGDGSTIGVRVTANRTLGISSSATLFHNTVVPANARVSVDLYMGFTGTGGTTEFGTVGLGATGTSPFRIFLPIEGDGSYYTKTGDGGSASDWRWSRPGTTAVGAPSVPVNSGSGRYLLGSTNAPFYDTCCGLIVDPVTGAIAGNGGNQWVTLEMITRDARTKIFINGTIVVDAASVGAADGTSEGGTAPGGFASFSYADVFSSVASPGDSQFGIFDNFKVFTGSSIPEPASMLMLGMGGLALALIRRRR